MLKILLADDEKYERESLKEIITDNFREKLFVSEVKNGREAIEVSEHIRPDIIIMDIKMPGINGIKAIEEIKKTIPKAYFIILTAYDYFDFAAESIKLNVKEYILKPYRTKDIINKLQLAIKVIEEEKEKRKFEIENEEKINNLMVVLQNELGYSIITNNLRESFLETYMKYLNVDFKNTFCMIIELLNEDNVDKNEVAEYINGFLSFRYKSICTFRHTKNLVYFIQLSKLYEDGEREFTTNIANRTLDEVKRFLGIDIKIGIGNVYHNIHLMNKSYNEALEAQSSNSKNITHIQSVEDEHESDSNKNLLFKNVEKYIVDNSNEQLDLETVAAKFNLSPYYFSRSFKEIVGSTFVDYINSVRIEKAKELLKKDQLSVKEICFQVGYSDPNYFSKVFKKYEGYTPTIYKGKN